MTGPPTFDPRPSYWLGILYLALLASVLTFSLYYPVVRKIGPAKAAYSSVLVPIIAMGFSTGSNIIAGPRRRSPAHCWRSAAWLRQWPAIDPAWLLLTPHETLSF